MCQVSKISTFIIIAISDNMLHLLEIYLHYMVEKEEEKYFPTAEILRNFSTRYLPMKVEQFSQSKLWVGTSIFKADTCRIKERK